MKMKQQNLFDRVKEYKNIFMDTHGGHFNYNGTWLKNGEVCPHCFRKVTANATRLSKPHAIALINMYKNGQDQYHYYNDVQVRGNNSMSKLKYYGLISKQKNEDPRVKSSGMYRLTHKGIEFILGNITIPEKVFIYNDTVLGFSEEHIKIYDISGQFDLRETIVTDHEMDQLS